MKLEQSFEVQAPLERVWRALIDIERVAPCLPGAAVTGRNEDGSYAGTFSVKVGPTSASYSGKLEMRDVDDKAHSATMYAQGSDKRGQGGASATILSTLAELEPNRTRVEVSTDYRITGRLARFGRGGMIEDISEKLLRRFAECLQSSLAEEPHQPEATPAVPGPPSGPPSAPPSGPPSAPPPPGSPSSGSPGPAPVQPSESLSGLSLIGDVLSDRIRANPAPVLAAVAVLGLMVGRRRRRRRRRRR